MSKQDIEIKIVEYAYARASKFGTNSAYYLEFFLAFYSQFPQYVCGKR